jgi:hypothetical protein
VCRCQLGERRLVGHGQKPIHVIFNQSDLVSRSDRGDFLAPVERHCHAGWILKIGHTEQGPGTTRTAGCFERFRAHAVLVHCDSLELKVEHAR